MDDVPDVEVSGVGLVDDLMIYASAPLIDGVGGILGQATPTSFRSSWLPSSGFMEFDQDDLLEMETSGRLIDLILHEMGHVIGIGAIWSETGVLEGASSSDPRFIGAAATQAYNEIFGNREPSVPVANTGGPGTANSHWREEVFGSELMTGYLNQTSNPLSRVTVASLADIGYVVNLGAADDYARVTSRNIPAARSFWEPIDAGLYYAQQLPETEAIALETLWSDVRGEEMVGCWQLGGEPGGIQQVLDGHIEWQGKA